jgi:site-specific DNA recombinase
MFVVAYYRMSSEDQADSIAQQQKEVRAFCQRQGWTIVAEYIDRGKSGSKDVEKRVEFHRLIANSSKGEWKAVVCYDSSRFGRLDALDGAPYKATLRKNGVHLESVKEGRIDWNTSMGRLQDALMSEANNDYSKKLAGNVLRGRLAAFENGYWPHGAIPFGYDRQLVEGEVTKMIVPRVENFTKPKHWKLKLVPNEKEAAVVVKMFKTFAERDISLLALCHELKTETGPSGIGWPYNSLVSTLKNPVYCGDVSFGLRQKNQRGKHDSATPQLKKDGCPPIVDRDIWERVQQKISNRMSGRQARKQKREYALAGCLVCGHCGHRLSGCFGVGHKYYTCLSAQNRPHLGCKFWKVREDKLLPQICRALTTSVDFELIKAIKSEPQPVEQSETKHLKAEIAALKKRVAKGSENLLLAEPEVFSAMQKSLMKWKSDLAKAENTLTLALAQTQGSEFQRWQRWWEAKRGKLVEVAPMEWGNRFWQPQPILPTPSLRARIDKHIGKVEIDGKVYERDTDGCYLQWTEMECPIRPAVEADVETLRELLHRLRLQVVLYWQPNGCRYFQLTRAILKAEFGEQTLQTEPSREVEVCPHMNINATPARNGSRSSSRCRLRRSRSARRVVRAEFAG